MEGALKKRYSNIDKIIQLLLQVCPGKGIFGQIFFTTKCNLRCRYCKVTDRTTNDIPLEEWLKIIIALKSWGVTYLSITGGESTIRKDLEDLIAFLKRHRIFSRLNSNGMLLTKARIDSLAEAGLCSLAISLDSLGDGKQIKNDSERVLDLLVYAKSKGIIAEARAVIDPSNPDGFDLLVQEVVDREIFFGFGMLQTVGGLFSKPSMQSPPIGGMAKHSNGLWLPESFFGNPLLHFDWKCDPTKDYWITVNNDGTLMPCQEWGSNIHALSIKNLKDPAWLKRKFEAVEHCPGCYYDCYYSQQMAMRNALTTLKEEFKGFKIAWSVLK